MANPYRLPKDIVPRHYRLRFEPFLDDATFTGSVEILADVTHPTEVILLNALDLEIGSVEVEAATGRLAPGIEYQPDQQRVRLSLSEPLEPGSVTIRLAFQGVLNDLLVGFYRSTYTDSDGVEQTIATTQFEATDARRAFPCFDEPSFKATFGVTLVVPEHLMAISNSPEVDRRPLDDGRVEITFGDTMIMSTYLLAMVVGPFEATEPVMMRGTPIRVITPKGKLHLAGFALESAAFALEYLSDYYDIPYPGDKLDNVAIPDFAFGAMENLGCVTYRESTLLVDRLSSTQGERLRVLDVVGHELAHMWFGDLVTMDWWDGIWLNEAFATFMEMKATDAARPDWRRWLAFAAEERPWAFGIDSLHASRPVEFEVESPEEANEMFDALTYGKGSAVLRMLEQFIGEEPFRSGIANYLHAHEYANTVTEDLWNGLDSVAGIGVAEIMGPWIHQRGFPQIDVTVAGNELRLDQRRYLSIPDETDTTLWKIPLSMRGSINGVPFERHELIKTPTTTLRFDGPLDWVLANAGGHGYMRINYTAADLDRILLRFGELDDLERYCLLDDTWAFVESNQLDLSSFLHLAERYGWERQTAIFRRLLQAVERISHHLITDATRPSFEQWVKGLLQPSFERLGWKAHAAETDLDRRMRGQLIGALGRFANDPAVIATSGEVAREWLANRADLDPEVAQAAILTLAATEGPLLWDELVHAYQTTENPQRQLRLLQAMADSGHPTTVDSLIEAILSGFVRSQDAAWVSGEMLADRPSGEYAWRQIRTRWPEVTSKMPSMTLSRLIEGIPTLSKPEVAGDITAFFAETPVPGAERALSQQLERLQVNVRLREAQTAAADEYFTTRS
jgi:puromycin-sensitive aminopeptidase